MNNSSISYPTDSHQLTITRPPQVWRVEAAIKLLRFCLVQWGGGQAIVRQLAGKAAGELLFCLSIHSATHAVCQHTQARIKTCTGLIRWAAECKLRGKPYHYAHMQSSVNDEAYLLSISIPHRGWLRGLKQSSVGQSRSAGGDQRRMWSGRALCSHDNVS